MAQYKSIIRNTTTVSKQRMQANAIGGKKGFSCYVALQQANGKTKGGQTSFRTIKRGGTETIKTFSDANDYVKKALDGFVAAGWSLPEGPRGNFVKLPDTFDLTTLPAPKGTKPAPAAEIPQSEQK